MTSVLIIAQSARALAQSAVKAGWQVCAIDQFGDQDTRAAAECAVVADFADTAGVLAAGERLLEKHRSDACIVGGGLECSPALIEAFGRRLPLMGNSAGIYRQMCHPASLCALLERLGIAHPETVLEGPAPSAGWLAKRAGGSGGGHIRILGAGESPGAGYYRQRRVDGISASALFLANGRDARILGYTRHWQAKPQADAGQPYLRSGLTRWREVPSSVALQVANMVGELTEAAGLRGLCGMDFVLDQGGQVVVLEVNPRPPASFELHEGDHSLLEAHRKASAGQLEPPPPAPARMVRSAAVMYTSDPLTIAAGFTWPDWCTDIPAVGTLIGSNRPVCSVTATSTDLETAQAMVQERLLTLRSELWKPTH